MAVANLEGFSIREYAAKMRSVDVAKCWPFGSSSSSRIPDGGDEGEELLPPISVVKFRWWAHLLPPPPPAPPQQQGKRTPKKRSIVEIFAVAPQIQRPLDDPDDDDVTNPDKKIKKRPNIKIKNKIKNKKTMKEQQQQSSDKEKICRFKPQKPLSLSRGSDSPLNSKKLVIREMDSVSIVKRKPSVKCNLSTQKKPKPTQQPKLTAKHQKPISPPVRSILKNHLEDIPTGDHIVSTPAKIPGGSGLISSCGVQHSGKRVRFSEMGPPSESDDELSALEIIESVDDDDDDNEDDTEIGTEVQPLPAEKKQLSNLSDRVIDSPISRRPNGTCQEKISRFPEKPLSLSEATAQDHDSSMFSQEHPCNASSPSYSVAATTSMASTRPFLLQSTPKSTNKTHAWPQKPACCHQPRTEPVWPHHKPPCCQPPTEPVCSFGPFPEWKQRGIVIGEQRVRSDNFIGLPLNSHGELIQSGYGINNHNNPTMVARSTADYLGLKESNPGDQLNFFPAHSYIGENSNASLLPARLGVMDMYSNPSRPYDHQESSGNFFLNKTQPTMRLMGKDVAVGKSSESVFGLEDGKVWTDKEIVAEHHHHHHHHHTFHGIENSGRSYFQPDWVLRPALGKQESFGNFQTVAPSSSRFSRPYLDFNTNLAFQHSTFPSLMSRVECQEQPRTQQPVLSNLAFPVMKSAFDFPFLHPDYYSRQEARPNWPGSSSKALPPWLQDATTQQRGQILMNRSIHHQEPVSYPDPLVQIRPRGNDRVAPVKPYGVRDPEFCKKSRKRTRDMAEGSISGIGLRRGSFVGGEPELGSSRVGCFMHDGFRASPGIDAGAKHLQKPDPPISSSRQERSTGFRSL